jgi:Domain of Unknown Function (DUF1080)
MTRGPMLLLVLIAMLAPAGQGRDDANAREWLQLFNGKNLDGWDVKITGHDVNDNFGSTFRVERGMLTTGYEQYGPQFNARFGHLFYRRAFSHYIVAVEYRFVGAQAAGAPDWAFKNSGVMVHAQSAASMTRTQDFPVSIEVQLLGGRETGDRPTANVCTPGTEIDMNGAMVKAHCTNSTAKTYRGEEWVRVEVEVLGGEQIRHIVDGQTVLAYQRPQIGGGTVSNFDPAVKKDGTPLSEGYIALQSESHPIEFRKVELLNLVGCTDAKAANYKTYFVKSDNSQCRYR